MKIFAPFPDNYVDSSFLEEMQKNVNVRTYDYMSLVINSGLITLQISSIMIFLGVFTHLYSGTITPNGVAIFSFVSSIFGYFIWIYNTPQFLKRANNENYKEIVMLFAIVLGLTPILKTLTEDTSSDTIWAFTIILFITNLLFFDYTTTGNGIQFPASVSVNAAIFASVLLASRLPTKHHVFSLCSYSVCWFVYFPMLCKALKIRSPNLFTIISISSFISASLLWFGISKLCVLLYSSVFMFITFVCPYWFISLQKYKNEIIGPWDEATIMKKTRAIG
ncbi:phosphatidylinositol N-acetylglucosaminyltransferase [Rozella allomycis CSF55]|uniref:Phosphatidylinositol N-acetylglucosaminyltransferase n=1 Tax=Rozella allomycis (strain CSF55) TaxID=988480 RepID=A0A075ASX8_ROZAC|nr:Phosphatidylinositol N-acetylglucosaminyltransferase domain-containing protein [Rozella allomycis CSF55]RKP21862.1 phosphatidylinositol N-acetylglucosaminyltransferase [Rozella allomycis CSF55]|eukprot:EPZ31588.1 Phosphatidylinositol N-acetylglucosaminyltransferase domain-containing protein [Rozella allomycis CSF55]